MTDSTTPPPDDDEWGGSGGDAWRQPPSTPPAEPAATPPPASPPPATPAPAAQPLYGGQQPAPPAPPPPGRPGAVPQKIPNYLVHSIVATVLCCLPTGIVGIIYASQVNGKLASGDVAGAKKASDMARLWSFVSLGVGLVLWVIWIIYAVSTSNQY